MQESTQQKHKLKRRVALTSILASGGLTIAKGVVGTLLVIGANRLAKRLGTSGVF